MEHFTLIAFNRTDGDRTELPDLFLSGRVVYLGEGKDLVVLPSEYILCLGKT